MASVRIYQPGDVNPGNEYFGEEKVIYEIDKYGFPTGRNQIVGIGETIKYHGVESQVLKPDLRGHEHYFKNMAKKKNLFIFFKFENLYTQFARESFSINGSTPGGSLYDEVTLEEYSVYHLFDGDILLDSKTEKETFIVIPTRESPKDFSIDLKIYNSSNYQNKFSILLFGRQIIIEEFKSYPFGKIDKVERFMEIEKEIMKDFPYYHVELENCIIKIHKSHIFFNKEKVFK